MISIHFSFHSLLVIVFRSKFSSEELLVEWIATIKLFSVPIHLRSINLRWAGFVASFEWKANFDFEIETGVCSRWFKPSRQCHPLERCSTHEMAISPVWRFWLSWNDVCICRGTHQFVHLMCSICFSHSFCLFVVQFHSLSTSSQHHYRLIDIVFDADDADANARILHCSIPNTNHMWRTNSRMQQSTQCMMCVCVWYGLDVILVQFFL